jgi:hypothetical protein
MPRAVAFPFEAVRDLLGIARAMWRAESDPVRRAALAEIGRALRDAGDKARQLPPASLGARAALRHAEEATKRLCDLVAGDAAPIVLAAAARVRRGA